MISPRAPPVVLVETRLGHGPVLPSTAMALVTQHAVAEQTVAPAPLYSSLLIRNISEEKALESHLVGIILQDIL